MENNPSQTTTEQEGKVNFAQEVKQFYAGDFKALFRVFFTDPFEGLHAVFQTPSDKSSIQALILFGSVFLLYFLGGFLLAGQMREYMGFAAFLNIALIPVLVMLTISAFSFLIKSISGKINFKSELLTGAICGIPLALVVALALVAKIFGNDGNLMTFFFNPMAVGSIIGVFMVYLLFMLINVFYQSLTSGGTKPLLAWYLSPLAILLAFYLAIKVSTNLFY
jgi:hypothetical protein